MKKRKFLYVLIGIMIFLIFIILFFNITHEEGKNTNGTNNTLSNSNDNFEQLNDKDSILADIEGEKGYYDPRSGFIFEVLDGAEIKDCDEYYCMIPEEDDASFILILNSDYDSQDGVESYNATYRLKERLSYFFNNNEEKKTVLYDGSELKESIIGNKLCRIEESIVAVDSNSRSENLKTFFINGSIDNKGAVVGVAVDESIDIDKYDMYKKQAEWIYTTLTSISYTGPIQDGFPSSLDFKESSLNGNKCIYPADWNEYKINDEFVAYKPVVMNKDIFQGASIVYFDVDIETKMGDPSDSMFSSLYVFDKYAAQFANATMQNPLIDNNRTFTTYNNGMVDEIHNGKTYYKAEFQHLLKTEDMHIPNSIPSKNIASKVYFTTGKDDSLYGVAFFYVDNRNKSAMEAIADYVLEII